MLTSSRKMDEGEPLLVGVKRELAEARANAAGGTAGTSAAAAAAGPFTASEVRRGMFKPVEPRLAESAQALESVIC